MSIQLHLYSLTNLLFFLHRLAAHVDFLAIFSCILFTEEKKMFKIKIEALACSASER